MSLIHDDFLKLKKKVKPKQDVYSMVQTATVTFFIKTWPFELSLTLPRERQVFYMLPRSFPHSSCTWPCLVWARNVNIQKTT